MLRHFQSRENRREWYMAVGLIFSALTVTHWLWGWPVGITPATQVNSETSIGVLGQIPWRHLLEGLPLVAVGILYYLGRRHGNRPPTHPASQLQITSVLNDAKVVGGQVIYGTAPRDIPATAIEVRVYAGGQWHSQGTARQFGDKWERWCWFGTADCPTGTRLEIVALVPKTPLPQKIATLPADALKSEIISVIRWTPPPG